ncbi:LecA/PA-IL family lectin [Argonema galeatum]|uniref:LecA/PA-IL family lectin n=1 Tax=Argonema galeatum TaxID=2942762 RepID=UPI002012843B|nr:LecA/PA-IL family lectin [Argonema galeatum]MCL1466002.1 LecA/PA-IL family lectin [Argonema galeatum A003/A1]
MTKSSIKLPSGELTVFAKEEKNLPSLTNQSDKTITLKIQAEGKWSYGGKDAFASQVDGDGNTAQTGRNPYMRFPDVTPAALVAVIDGKPVGSGKEHTIEIPPGKTVSFINNDQPGVYGDNSGSLTIKWSIASIKNGNGSTSTKEESIVSGPDNKTFPLPSGELIVFATEEENLPSLINESDKKITLKIQAEGTWNYGWSDNNAPIANMVDANGNPANTGREPYMRFQGITPAALVAVKDDRAVANGKEQTVELNPGETVSFINNDQQYIYFDNSGSQTVKWSILSVN